MLDPDSDLGDLQVTTAVGALPQESSNGHSIAVRRRPTAAAAGLDRGGGAVLKGSGGSKDGRWRQARRDERPQESAQIHRTVEETFHDGGQGRPSGDQGGRGGVIANPYAGRHVAHPAMMKALERGRRSHRR